MSFNDSRPSSTSRATRCGPPPPPGRRQTRARRAASGTSRTTSSTSGTWPASTTWASAATSTDRDAGRGIVVAGVPRDWPAAALERGWSDADWPSSPGTTRSGWSATPRPPPRPPRPSGAVAGDDHGPGRQGWSRHPEHVERLVELLLGDLPVGHVPWGGLDDQQTLGLPREAVAGSPDEWSADRCRSEARGHEPFDKKVLPATRTAKRVRSAYRVVQGPHGVLSRGSPRARHHHEPMGNTALWVSRKRVHPDAMTTSADPVEHSGARPVRLAPGPEPRGPADHLRDVDHRHRAESPHGGATPRLRSGPSST